MRRRKVSKLRLLSELRKLLARPDTQVVHRKLRNCGQSTWTHDDDDPLVVSDIRVYLDPRRDGRVRLVIHELLHVFMAMHFALDSRLVYELEEAGIKAWEDLLYAWLHHPSHEAALESWNKAIERKTRA